MHAGGAAHLLIERASSDERLLGGVGGTLAGEVSGAADRPFSSSVSPPAEDTIAVV